MSTQTTRTSKSFQFFWTSKFTQRIEHVKDKTRFNVDEINWHTIREHHHTPAVIDYNWFMMNVLLPRLNQVMEMYNNFQRPFRYIIRFNLNIEHNPRGLTTLNVENWIQNLIASNINLYHRYKLKRAKKHIFVNRQAPWSFIGIIDLQLKFFPCLEADFEEKIKERHPTLRNDLNLEPNQGILIEDIFTNQ